ncbi:myosin heavy chain, clone 203-like [Onthophagus taurus]|uniref:myosin heavy chain, clone 203-like n=1 Tax=Onthophagus taurus TaxID=166361 RepID=UPI0039BE600A
MNEVENKLDEDYLFYLGFTTSFFHRLPSEADVAKCKSWLERLCGTPCQGVEAKRNRNIFLSNLVLCMQEGRLTGPFLENPKDVDILKASNYFGEMKCNNEEPEWLEEVVAQGAMSLTGDEGPMEHPREDGRTYVATRTMPNGQGAFAYVAVSLADDEPMWLGGGEGVFDARMKEKFQEFIPPITEMERILAKRKDPKERERVMTFYNVLLRNIADELDGLVKQEDNDTVNGLIDQLERDLAARGKLCCLQDLSKKEKRTELLLMLHDRVYSRRVKVQQREEVLDNIEKSLPKSFFDMSLSEEDRYKLPSLMWEQAICKAPQKKNLITLQETYPGILVKKFIELMANQKEEIAIRMQRRHDNIVSQMKKELRIEGEKFTKWVETARVAMDRAVEVQKAVQAARFKQLESEMKAKRRKRGGITEKTELYEQMAKALFDQQQNVELESEKGRMLTEEINHLNAQTEMIQQVTNDNVMKQEEANIAIMKNIKKLQQAITANEKRLHTLEFMANTRLANSQQAQMFIF